MDDYDHPWNDIKMANTVSSVDHMYEMLIEI